ncbi:MAG: aminotransferase class V-fold PLP-dependent enzyme [Balneolaceae bacterium]|nr:MAG: aminotransferase class V-fold PLP-dependent enzyme [Balneolaceae bacterium]
MQEFDKLALSLHPHYSHFNVTNRLLFTGHSHQAWPDAAFAGILEYSKMVAEQVDKKWEFAFEKTEILREYLRNFYDDPSGKYCREQNTHVLLVSWLSALDLKNKPKIITTTGEFHSMSRQLRSLQEAGLNIVFLPHQNDSALLEAIKKELDEKTSAVMLSRVYYQTAEINTKLPEIARVTKQAGIPLLVDDYHGTNVVPLSLQNEDMEHIYILIGGYKYLQWGEANCFLRYPANCELKPVITGWFSAFQQLDKPKNNNTLYFDDGDQKFATGTYDPISQYRSAAVAQFFNSQGLTPDILRHQYSSQLTYLRNLFDDANFTDSAVEHANQRPAEESGGFMALRTVYARKLRSMLLDEHIFTDARNEIIRIGPAPYTTSLQCQKMIKALFKNLKIISSNSHTV